jgi:adenylate cyclase class 2
VHVWQEDAVNESADDGPREVESKYRLGGPAAHDALRARLVALGARRGAVEQERNVLFDRPDHSLRAADRVLRLRVLDGGPAGRLTYKGPADYAAAVKSRTELEIAVDDCRIAHALLEALGYVPSLEYPKERETWYLEGAEVALDVLPFGTYCEIEGLRAVIPRLAAALGLPDAAAEAAGYPTLMARHLQMGHAAGP